MLMNIRLLRSATNKVEVIDMETYVAGVVAQEMGSSFPSEALKAQAIASRSYALTKMNKGNATYDISDNSSKHQAYNPSKVNATITAAVQATAGMVVTYGGKIAQTVYSASNGGRIKSAKEVWGGSIAYLISKNDPYNAAVSRKYPKNGHSVGMSQRGAEQAAKQGLNYSSILKFYYPGTSITGNYNGVTTGASGTAGNATPTKTTAVINKGLAIVEEAKKYLGMPYTWGGSTPSTSFDCSGYTYHCYKVGAGYNWSRMSAYAQYKLCLSKGTRVSLGSLSAGDLVFFEGGTRYVGNPNITHVGIATGNGTEMINAQSAGIKYSNITSWSSPKFHSAYRLLATSETSCATCTGSGVDNSISPDTQVGSATANPSIGSSAGLAYLSSIDTYKDIMMEELQEISAEGYDYGYLIDLTYGGEFKFYIPDYGKNLSVSYSPITILGRSVPVQAYQSSGPTSVSLKLDLMAGAGLYSGGTLSDEDMVENMHNDIAFVESLLYPDYSKAYVQPPSIVLLSLGPKMTLKGIVTSVNTDYMKPFTTNNTPMYCQLSFTVTQLSDVPPDLSDIRLRTSTSY